MPERSSILAIRLSALGDIIHALPAITCLKQSFPSSKLALLIAPRWLPIVEGNPFIDELIPPNLATVRATVRHLRPDLAFDFQGLLKSALLGRLARPKSFFGFDRSVARESFASLFYTHRIPVTGPHRVERNLQLIAAAGASTLVNEAWIPPGRSEGHLPSGPFVLTSPFAGWAGKQWPIENYDTLGQILSGEGFELAANVPAQRASELASFRHVHVHTSSISGLIDATRRAAAIVGVDSGPLHLAAALRKPGVALFGPTDPRLTGPYGGTVSVIRTDDVATTYKRHANVHPSMRVITPQQVAETLLHSLANTPVRRS
jgi:heptosyltransferase-1